jgi:hypothetical protein
MVMNATWRISGIKQVLAGLDSMYKNSPSLRMAVLRICGTHYIKLAQSFLGVGNPINPWAPLSGATEEWKSGLGQNNGPLKLFGGLGKAIKITKLTANYTIVTAGLYQSHHRKGKPAEMIGPEILEKGVRVGRHTPFRGSVNIPARPFMEPAYLMMEQDNSFWSRLENFIGEQYEALDSLRGRNPHTMFNSWSGGSGNGSGNGPGGNGGRRARQ